MCIRDRAAKDSLSITDLLSYQFFPTFHHQFISFHWQISSWSISRWSICCLLVCSSAIWGLVVLLIAVYWTPGVSVYPHPGVFSQLGVSLGRSWNSVKFQGISNTPKNHQSGLPRPPKVSKMMSKWVPEIIIFTKKLKMWNLMKIIVFIIQIDRLGHQKSLDFPFNSH